MAAKESDAPDRGSTPLWVSKDIVQMAKMASAARGQTIREFVEGLLRGPVTQEYRAAVAALSSELAGGA